MNYTAHFGQYWTLHHCYMYLLLKISFSMEKINGIFISGTLLLCSLDRWGFAIRNINKIYNVRHAQCVFGKFKEVCDFLNKHWCPYPYKGFANIFEMFPIRFLSIVLFCLFFVCVAVFCYLFSSIFIYFFLLPGLVICITANESKLTTQPQIHCKHSKLEMLYFGTFPSHNVWLFFAKTPQV